MKKKSNAGGPCLAIREDSERKKHLRLFPGGPASIGGRFGDLGIFSFGGVFFAFSESEKKNNTILFYFFPFGKYNLLKNKIFFDSWPKVKKVLTICIFFIFF